MKKRLIISIISISMNIVLLFSSVALGFNVSNQTEKIKVLETENQSMKQEAEMLSENNSSSISEDRESSDITNETKTEETQKTSEEEGDAVKRMAYSFLVAQFEYNSDTYKSHLDDVMKYTTPEVFTQLNPDYGESNAEDVANEIKFESVINSKTVYITEKNAEEYKALAVVVSEYHNSSITTATPISNIYELTISKQDTGEWLVSQFVQLCSGATLYSE